MIPGLRISLTAQGGEGKKESSKQKKQHVCKLGGWHADFVVEREAGEEVY